MKFSLIMPTLNRVSEVEKFILSVIDQQYRDFELIIVDQNTHDKLKGIVEKYNSQIVINYVKSKNRGLSLNRNVGLNAAIGDIVCFPDDDCEYDPYTLFLVNSFFSENPNYSFYTCNTKARDSDKSIYRGLNRDTDVTVKNFMSTGCSITIFAKKSALYGFRFDEMLGAGSEFGSSEESDFLMHLLQNQNKGYYFHDVYVYHPYEGTAGMSPQRYYSYGKGFGALIKKTVMYRNQYSIIPYFALVVFRNVVAIFLFYKSKCHIDFLRGVLFGIRKYPIKETMNRGF